MQIFQHLLTIPCGKTEIGKKQSAFPVREAASGAVAKMFSRIDYFNKCLVEWVLKLFGAEPPRPFCDGKRKAVSIYAQHYPLIERGFQAQLLGNLSTIY